MTSEIISMVIGGAISAIIGSLFSFLFWAGVQRKIERSDKQVDGLKETVRSLKDEKVSGLESRLDNAISENHDKHAGLHGKIEAHAGALHEKINRQADVFITRRECALQHENTSREIGNLRHDLQALRGQVGEVATTVHESATVTKLIADKMNVSLPEKRT